jgi:hypothetical protein
LNLGYRERAMWMIVAMMAACARQDGDTKTDDTGATGPGLVWNREALACDPELGGATWALPEEPIAVVRTMSFLNYAGTDTLLEQQPSGVEVDGAQATVGCRWQEGFDSTAEVTWAYWVEDVAADQGAEGLTWHREALDCDTEQGTASWTIPADPIATASVTARHLVPGSGEVVDQSAANFDWYQDQGVARAPCTPSDIYDTVVEVTWATWGDAAGSSEDLVWTEEAVDCEQDGMSMTSFWTVPEDPLAVVSYSTRDHAAETGDVVYESHEAPNFEDVPVGESTDVGYCGMSGQDGATTESAVVWATWEE